jgi:GNAT superfamily N-acetyltransferase
VDVRVAGPDDAAALARLRVRWGEEWGAAGDGSFAASFEEWVRDNAATHTAFVAVHDGEVVGMAWLAAYRRPPSPERGARVHGDVQSVYVLPAYRDVGVGTLLVSALIEEGRRLGLRRLTVQSSDGAVALYERAGFAASERLLRMDL